MRDYILTERGKILIAVLIMFFLIMPSLIFVLWAFTRDSAQNEPNGSQGTHQSSSGLENSETNSKTNTETTSDSAQDSHNGESSALETYDPALSGPITFDINAGTITFLFTPEKQTTLDDNTYSIIGSLLSSHDDNEKRIAVEIPQLSDEDTAILTSAIIDAFSVYEVPLSDIVFFVYQPESDLLTFAISISLIY